MTDSDSKNEKELLKLAEKISDAVDDEQADSEITDDDIYSAALKKIKKASQVIRQASELDEVVMQKGAHWAGLKIIEKIGQGGIGEVYKAFDPDLDCDVAVKFLKRKSRVYISQKQFLDEARNMAKVRHPHVLAIHGATVENNLAGYWCDYLDGEILSDKLSAQQLEWSQILDYAKQLAEALQQIHVNQLVHGDIKALNVMVQPNRGVILLDFGSSKKSNLSDKSESLVQASPLAMAPEQFEGQAANTASDVFSMGVLFWHMSTGQHPLREQDFAQLKMQISTLHQRVSEVIGTRDWRHLIGKMVHPDIKQRPDIAEVLERLEDLKQKPLKRAKRVAVASLLFLAAGITTVALVSDYKTRQANHEAMALNTLLSDILLKSSPIEAGKDVLLVDVLSDAEDKLMNNDEISEQQKYSSLLQLVKTYRQQGKYEQSLLLSSSLLSQDNLTNSMKMDLLVQKAAALNDNRDYEAAEALLAEAVTIPVVTDDDKTLKISTMINLIRIYNESYRLEKVPDLINEVKSVWKGSSQKLAALANIYLIEGNYYEIMEQFDRAFELYQLSVENFAAHYGPQNIDVMIAKGAAATVLTYQDSTRVKGVEMLQVVVTEMTEFLGADHSSALIARFNLADSYSQLGEPEKAIMTIEPYLPDVYQAFGEEGGMTMHFEHAMAAFYADSGRFDVAEQKVNKVIDIQQRKHGVNSAQVLESQYHLLMLKIQAKQLVQAEQLAHVLMTTIAEHQPDASRLSLNVEQELIWIGHLNGTDVTAEMQDLIDRKTAQFGAEDPSTLSALSYQKEMSSTP